MESRYDYFDESDVADIDNELYPDPNSINYDNVQLTKIAPPKQLSSADISKFWLWMEKTYSRDDLDDLLLNINGIPYLGTLEPGDIICLVDPNDLQSIKNSSLPGEEDY